MIYSRLKPLMVMSLIALGTWSACSSTQNNDQVKGPHTETEALNETSIDSAATYFTEVDFEKGATRLGKEDYQAIADLVQKSMREGKIDEIKVVTYADQDYPSGAQKKLPSAQRKIAESRNEEISQYLKESYPSLEVNFYNMAARPGVIQELFKTSDATTKKSFDDAGITSLHAPKGGESKRVSRSVILSVVKRNY